MPFEIIAQSHHPLGGFFLARQPDQSLLAGRDEATARSYPTPEVLYEVMSELAARGHHWAWNLCYEAQGLVDGDA